MPTRDDIYKRFGEASETAQLLETELARRAAAVRELRSAVSNAGGDGKRDLFSLEAEDDR